MLGNCRCGAGWNALAVCHCTGCHSSFASLSAFDAHRRAGRCLDPGSLGMEPNQYGYLRVPREDEDE